VHRDLKAILEQLDHEVHKDQKVTKEIRGHKDLQDLLVIMLIQ
jgi:hypothetical protein